MRATKLSPNRGWLVIISMHSYLITGELHVSDVPVEFADVELLDSPLPRDPKLPGEGLDE